MRRSPSRWRDLLSASHIVRRGGAARRIIAPWLLAVCWVAVALATPGARAPFTTVADEPDAIQQGPWLVQRPSPGDHSAQYMVVTPSLEDGNFWLGVVCFGDGRSFLSFADTKDEIFPDQVDEFQFWIQFDSRAPLPVKARYVNGHMIAVDPRSSTLLLVAMLHSRNTRILSLTIGQRTIARTFVVQPVSPALDPIIDGCLVGH
jgi:hypothetical protein